MLKKILVHLHLAPELDCLGSINTCCQGESYKMTLPHDLLHAQAYASIRESSGEVLRIPIKETHVRSLNLAASAGIALYEGIRQLDGPH